MAHVIGKEAVLWRRDGGRYPTFKLNRSLPPLFLVVRRRRDDESTTSKNDEPQLIDLLRGVAAVLESDPQLRSRRPDEAPRLPVSYTHLTLPTNREV